MTGTSASFPPRFLFHECAELMFGLLLVFFFFESRGFKGVLKEFDSTEKHQHTLLELGTVVVLRLVPRFGRDCGFLGVFGVLFVILM